MSSRHFSETAELIAHGVACRRGGRLVFAGLSCRVSAGGVLLLTGTNGSGKSSLLRVLATLVRPEAGRLDWQGAPVTDDLPGYRAALHYAGHLDALKPAMTVRETLTVAAALRGHQADPKIGGGDAPDAALEALAIDHLAEFPCRFLSAGQRRRLALARLLVSPAPLWLLDEPTAALDAEGELRLCDIIATHRAAGGIAIIATHVPLAVEPADALRLDNFVPQPTDPAVTDSWEMAF